MFKFRYSFFCLIHIEGMYILHLISIRRMQTKCKTNARNLHLQNDDEVE